MTEKKVPLVSGRLKDYIEVLESNKKKTRVVHKKDETKWVLAENGSRTARMIAPENGFDIRLHVLSQVEIAPGGKGPLHRHGDAAIYILSGRGYAIVDGKRFDYEEGDAALMPAGVWHQQFNADPDKPLRFIAAQALYQGLVLSDTAEED